MHNFLYKIYDYCASFKYAFDYKCKRLNINDIYVTTLCMNFNRNVYRPIKQALALVRSFNYLAKGFN